MSETKTISVSTRMPQWWMAAIERHQERLRQTTRTPRVTLADALRDLIALGIESQEPGIKLFGGQLEQLDLAQASESLQEQSSYAASSASAEVQTVAMPAAAPPPVESPAPPGASAIEHTATVTTPTVDAVYVPPGHEPCDVNPRHRPFPIGKQCLACRQNAYARKSTAKRRSQARGPSTAGG